MLKVLNANSGVGSEVKLRDYSEPLQNQRDISSYASRYVYNFDFGVEPDVTDLHIYENQMIRIWRAMAENPYIDFAVDDIVNEMYSKILYEWLPSANMKKREEIPIIEVYPFDMSGNEFEWEIRIPIF